MVSVLLFLGISSQCRLWWDEAPSLASAEETQMYLSFAHIILVHAECCDLCLLLTPSTL